MRRAVFLDRDGTLIVEKHYLRRVEDLELYPETLQALKVLRATGLALVLVTNQSGIGRGLLDEATLGRLHDRLRELLLEGEISLDGIYHCPHVPAGGEAGCRCRKPGPEMLERAAADLDLDLKGSWVIGDKAADIDLGESLPLRSLLVLTGHGAATATEPSVPDRCEAVFDNILGAARHIALAEETG